MGEKIKKIYKPVAGLLCVLIIVLSISGAAISAGGDETSTSQNLHLLKTSQDLFICVIIFSTFALLLALFVKFNKSGDKSKYEINEKSEKPPKGLDNVAFDGEKGAKKEKWMENYVPYGQFPKGSAIEEETVTVENEKVMDSNKEVDSNKDDEKWKENYVAYEEDKTEEKTEKSE